jgi:hypothetical protein
LAIVAVLAVSTIATPPEPSANPQKQLALGAVVAFHDYSLVWPGVMQASMKFAPHGDVFADVFVWRNGGHASRRLGRALRE